MGCTVLFLYMFDRLPTSIFNPLMFAISAARKSNGRPAFFSVSLGRVWIIPSPGELELENYKDEQLEVYSYKSFLQEVHKHIGL